jgi:hypothetical protein
VGTETIAQIYAHRETQLAALAERARNEELQQKENALQSALETVRKLQAADHSVKKRMRDLLAAIDTQIIRRVDAGERTLTIRMQPADIEGLQSLIAEAGDEKLLTIVGYGVTMLNSVIMNGTLGPSAAVPEQTQVRINIFPILRGTP